MDPAAAAVGKEHHDVCTVDEETFAALRWASGLQNDSCVLAVIRSLPQQVLDEQVVLYRAHLDTAVAATAKPQASTPQPKLSVCNNARLAVKRQVSHRLHTYCPQNGIAVDKRMPYGAMRTFIKDN